MEYGDNNTNCVVIKCRIEAKEASGVAVHGFYMCAMDGRDIEYDGALFSRGAIETEAPFSALYAMLEAPGPDDREEMKKYENGLKDYVRTSRLFQSEKHLDDPKALEHKITYFCTSIMSLNAISFLELATMSRDELYLAIPPPAHEDEPESGEDQGEQADESTDGETKDSAPPDVVLSCDPVLDPVSGVPAGGLSVGDVICCKLREDSVFFDLMAKTSPDFNGIVSGDITAIHVNELGSAVVSLKLSDGIAGALKLAGNVRIKALPRKESKMAGMKSLFRLDVLLAVSGVAIFLFAMWVLLRVWG
ncbi:MAG: hypothetical protein LBG12_00570 [Synergistaceae bacterium]|jgi:hypothetical protein|nr:hypothetical protein [Synergistaceae bacterium]